MKCNHNSMDNLPFHNQKHCTVCGMSELEIKLQAQVESLRQGRYLRYMERNRRE